MPSDSSNGLALMMPSNSSPCRTRKRRPSAVWWIDLAADLDIADHDAGMIAEDTVVIAGDIDDPRAVFCLAEQGADDVVVRLRPDGTTSSCPQVDDVADQVERSHSTGAGNRAGNQPAAPEAEVDVRDEYAAHPQRCALHRLFVHPMTPGPSMRAMLAVARDQATTIRQRFCDNQTRSNAGRRQRRCGLSKLLSYDDHRRIGLWRRNSAMRSAAVTQSATLATSEIRTRPRPGLPLAVSRARYDPGRTVTCCW